MTGNGERDSQKIFKMHTLPRVQWAISSQAPWKQGEGSTTNAYSPNVKPRAMKRHECSATPHRVDEIVWSSVKTEGAQDKEPGTLTTNTVRTWRLFWAGNFVCSSPRLQFRMTGITA